MAAPGGLGCGSDRECRSTGDRGGTAVRSRRRLTGRWSGSTPCRNRARHRCERWSRRSLDSFGLRTYSVRSMPRRQSPLDAPPLDQRIATGLHKIGLVLKHQTWAQANEEGVSPTQGQILAVLAADGALSASEVAMRLGIGLPTISEAVSTLVEKRLVRRSQDPRHPRARLLRLTASGLRRARKARAWPEFLVSAVGSLSEAEQDTLLTALMKMIRALQEQGEIPASRMCATCEHFRPNVHKGTKPHHCAFVDAPMAPQQLRLDCADHHEASADQQRAAWARFLQAV